MRRCSAIYPELFTLDDTLPSSGTDANESQHSEAIQALPKPAQQQFTPPVSMRVEISGRTEVLNLAKIRSDMVISSHNRSLENAGRVISNRRKIILLQALRWVRMHRATARNINKYVSSFSVTDPDGKWTAIRGTRCFC